MKRSLFIAAVVFGLAAPAFASQCPSDMNAINAALETTTVSAEDKAKVEELLKAGEELHNDGKHDESVATLGEAKKILGIQ